MKALAVRLRRCRGGPRRSSARCRCGQRLRPRAGRPAATARSPATGGSPARRTVRRCGGRRRARPPRTASVSSPAIRARWRPPPRAGRGRLHAGRRRPARSGPARWRAPGPRRRHELPRERRAPASGRPAPSPTIGGTGPARQSGGQAVHEAGDALEASSACRSSTRLGGSRRAAARANARRLPRAPAKTAVRASMIAHVGPGDGSVEQPVGLARCQRGRPVGHRLQPPSSSSSAAGRRRPAAPPAPGAGSDVAAVGPRSASAARPPRAAPRRPAGRRAAAPGAGGRRPARRLAPLPSSTRAARSCCSSRSPGGRSSVDRRRDQRVHEAERVLVAQHLRAGQRGDRRGGLALGEPGQLGDRGQGRAVAEHGDGPRHVAAARAASGRSRISTMLDTAREPIARTVSACEASGRTPSASSARQQLAQQQRVAGGGAVAGRDEGVVRHAPSRLPHQVARRPSAVSGRGRDGDRVRVVGQDLVHAASSSACGSPVRRVATTSTGRPSSAAGEVGEEAQGGGVAPLQVVDGEQHRPVGGEVAGQPVEPVQHRERAVPPVLVDRRRGVEHPPRRSAAAPVSTASRVAAVGEQRLEQLAHRAEAELPLQLAARADSTVMPGRRGRLAPRRAAGSCRCPPGPVTTASRPWPASASLQAAAQLGRARASTVDQAPCGAGRRGCGARAPAPAATARCRLRGAGAGASSARRLRQHLRLQRAQRRPGIDAELVGQGRRARAQRGERVGLPVRAVQREGEQPPALLAQRVLPEQGLDLRDHSRALATVEPGRRAAAPARRRAAPRGVAPPGRPSPGRRTPPAQVRATRPGPPAASRRGCPHPAAPRRRRPAARSARRRRPPRPPRARRRRRSPPAPGSAPAPRARARGPAAGATRRTAASPRRSPVAHPARGRRAAARWSRAGRARPRARRGPRAGEGRRARPRSRPALRPADRGARGARGPSMRSRCAAPWPVRLRPPRPPPRATERLPSGYRAATEQGVRGSTDQATGKR